VTRPWGTARDRPATGSHTSDRSAPENCSALLGYYRDMVHVPALLCVALVATGCFSPGFADCKVTCASGNGCPDGYACISGLCRAGGNTGPCASTPDDGGGDGPGKEIDSGPTVDDEDSDGMLDSVDPCPISANNADADGDGVGDACEPVAGNDDRILRFEGFNGTSFPADAIVLGNWTVSGGKAHVISAANAASSVTLPITSALSVRETVFARVTVDGLFSTPADPTGAGVVTRASTDGAQGLQCALGRDPNSGTDHLLLVKVASGADTRINSIASLATPGTSAILQITRNPTNDVFACNQNGTSTIAFTPPSPVPTGSLGGVRTRSMSATFDWVMIISSQ
jgi:hypothetical protein